MNVKFCGISPTGNSDQEARALLAEQFGKFTLRRVKVAQGWSYQAQGSVNFFGDSLVRVDGAGGQIESVRAYRFTLPAAA